MRFEHSDRLPINNDRKPAELVTSGIVFNRPNLEIEEQNIYDDNKAEVILRYVDHEQKDCKKRHIVVSAEEDEITINAVAVSDEKLPGLKVGLKGVARNIRASLAGKADSEAV